MTTAVTVLVISVKLAEEVNSTVATPFTSVTPVESICPLLALKMTVTSDAALKSLSITFAVTLVLLIPLAKIASSCIFNSTRNTGLSDFA